jgi:Rad3-related DNA helicase
VASTLFKQKRGGMGVNGGQAEGSKSRFVNFRGRAFRPGQEEAIERALASDRKAVVVTAPTGSGKSLIGMAAGAAYSKSCYLCSSRQLQRQVVGDFPEALPMMGRNNFPCVQDYHRTADLCIHTPSTPCGLKFRCPYEVHKRRVAGHPLQILNYSYFLTEANYVGKFSEYPLMVSDEADALEGLLTGFIELRLSRNRLETLGIRPPRRKTAEAKDGLAAWREWADDVGKSRIAGRIRRLEEQIGTLRPEEELSEEEMALVREYKALDALRNKLEAFVTHMDESWIFQEHGSNENVEAWTFQPTWLTPELSEQYFFRHAQRHLLMSATFPPKAVLSQMLGLPTGDIEYVEIPSTFPAANRPVVINPVADMGYKTFNSSLPGLLKTIEKILKKHRREKGIIHTVSWKLNEAVMRIGNPRLVSHNSHDKDEQLGRFIKSPDGVFVSPSSTRGVDLPDDKCRFVIIAKAPFQSLADKLVSSRVYGSGLGAYWYRAICAQDIVQASGRGVRHQDDYCVTYLLDKQIEKLVVDNQNLFPGYWKEALDYI